MRRAARAAEPSALPEGYRLVALASVPSTNDEAKRLAAAGEPAGLVVVAGEQTAGRGRHRRTWISPPGNLYLSIVLRPTCPVARTPELGFVAALAVADAVAAALPAGGAAAGDPVRCKWPNDVLLDGGKVAGLLLETAGEAGGRVDWLVAGIGINVATSPGALPGAMPATSLAAAGATIDAAGLLPHLLQAFAARHRFWEEAGFAPLRALWRSRAHRAGDMLTVRLADRSIGGRYVDIDDNGALILDTPSGRRTVTAGDCLPAGAVAAAG